MQPCPTCGGMGIDANGYCTQCQTYRGLPQTPSSGVPYDAPYSGAPYGQTPPGGAPYGGRARVQARDHRRPCGRLPWIGSMPSATWPR